MTASEMAQQRPNDPRSERALHRLYDLLAESERVTRDTHATSFGRKVAEYSFGEWRTRSLNALRDLLGDSAPLVRDFEAAVEETYVECVMRGAGILSALARDIEQGYFTSLETMITVDVFTDFLDMAEQLLDHENGHIPAASLVGGVLEDSLRRLTTSKGIAFKPNDDIGDLNGKLAKAHVYNAAQAREISLWKFTRDKAAQGEFEEVEPARVRDMLSGVNRFIAIYMI